MSVPTSATETGATSNVPQRVGPVFIGIYVLALFGIWMSINLPASVTLALRIDELDPDGKATSYSMAAGIGTLTALIANPLFGRLSDRTRSRFGRRRPWIWWGSPARSPGLPSSGSATQCRYCCSAGSSCRPS